MQSKEMQCALPTKESKLFKHLEMPSSLPINADLTELVATLNSHNLEFIIVGAHALAFHGIPRFTEDIDLFVRRTKENVKRLADALSESAITLDESGQRAFCEDERGMIVIGNEPNRADILNFLSGIEFEEAWENKVAGEIAGIAVYYISKDDYRKTKLAAGRPKDIADLALLDASNTD